MPQADLFQQLGDALVANNATIRQTNAAFEEMIEHMGQIKDTHDEILKFEIKEMGLVKGSLNVLKKMGDAFNDIKKTKKEGEKIDQAIANLGKIDTKNNTQLAAIIKSQTTQLKLKSELNKIEVEQMKQSLPMFSQIAAAGQKAGSFFGGVLNGISSAFGLILGAVKILGNILAKPFEIFLKMQSTVGNLAADIGLTKQQSAGLMKNFTSLVTTGIDFGATMEDVASIFKTFSETTGKNRFFSEEEIASVIELGKGTGLGVEGAADLAANFDNVGISLTKTIKLTDQARNMAAKLNLNTLSVIKSYSGLVKALVDVGFGGGLANLTNLAAKAQAIRFDIVKSTESFKDAFFDPEKAVEAAAKMQVLGGKFAQSFGDPMQLAFESMNDPTKLAEKMADAMKDKVSKAADGSYFISPADRKMLKLAAEAMGQDYENLVSTSIEQAKIADKMVALSKSGFSLMGFNESDKLGIATLMKDGKDGFMIQTSDGTDKLVSQLGGSDAILRKMLDEKTRDNESAIKRKNFVDRLELIVERFMTGFSTIFTEISGILEASGLMSSVEKLGQEIGKNLIPFIQLIFADGGKVTTFIKNLSDELVSVFNEVSEFFKASKADGFLGTLKEGLFTLVKSLISVVLPYLKVAFAEMLISIGKATGFKTLEVGGEKMLLDEVIKDSKGKAINSVMDKKRQGQMQEDIKGHGTDLSLKQYALIAGVVLAGIGATIATAGVASAPAAVVTAGAISAIVAGETAIGAKGYNLLHSDDDKYGSSMKQIGVKDALVTPHGIVKGDKNDIWMALHSGGMQNPGNNMGSGNIDVTGTIIIKSEDGKAITWDMLHASASRIGQIVKKSASYENGFGDFNNPNELPIRPLNA